MINNDVLTQFDIRYSKPFGYVYLILNKINEKIYIGQTIKNNPDYYGSGYLIVAEIEKLGKQNFEKIILEECPDFETLNNKEIYWIDKFDSRNPINGYNIAKGGQTGWFSGCKHSEETKQIMSEKGKGDNNHFYGKKHSEETKKIMSEKRKNLKLAVGENNGMFGKKHSEESKQKMRKPKNKTNKNVD